MAKPTVNRDPPEPDPEGDDPDSWPAWLAVIEGVVWYLLLPPALGLGFSLFCDAGEGAQVDLFAVVAQIAPVITLAELVAYYPATIKWMRIELDRLDRVGDPEDMAGGAPLFIRGALLKTLGLLAVIEVAALTGVALGHSTAFLLVTMLSGLVLQFVAFFQTQYGAFSIGLQSEEDLRTKFEEKD
jgi:hypothetical protein